MGRCPLFHHLVRVDDLHLALSSRLARILSGHFSPTEIVLTLIIGVASLTGLGVSLRWPTKVTWGKGLATSALLAMLQLAALRISFIPYIASH
jgi:hypothetical protein